MSTKIGPIQTREEKDVVFDFSDEGVTGTLSNPIVTLVVASTGLEPSGVKVGSPSIDAHTVVQRVKYQVDGELYLVQGTATDSAGAVHTASAYLSAKAVA